MEAVVTQVITVPPIRCGPRLRRWSREVALMVLDRIRSGRGPYAVWAFGRSIYYGPWAQGVPKRATLIGIYNERAILRFMVDDIEVILEAEPIHAVA